MDEEGDYYGNGDYDYPEEEDYGQMEQEDIQTKVQIDFYQAEGLIRNDNISAAEQKLEQLYQLSEENNLRNWKPKILNHLLDLSCRKKDGVKIVSSLKNILKLNQSQKLTDTAVKSIITTLKIVDTTTFSQHSAFIEDFFAKLEPANNLKGLLFMLEKQISFENKQKAVYLLKKTTEVSKNIKNIAPDQLLYFYSLQVKVSKLANINISSRLRKMQMRLSYLQNQAYMNEGSLSVLKEALAEVHYKNDNYAACIQYLCQAFQEYVRFGKSSGLKEVLKRNAVISVLCDDRELADKYNALYDESSSAFKSDSDVFPIYGFIQAFNQLNETAVRESLKGICLLKDQIYFDIQDRIVKKIRKRKLLQMLRVYQRVKFDFLQKRIKQQRKNLQNMAFQLIVENQIRGVIHSREGYIEILPPQNQFLTTQLKNIQQLSNRY